MTAAADAGKTPIKWRFYEDPDRTTKPRYEVRNEGDTRRIALVFMKSHAQMIARAPEAIAQRDALADALAALLADVDAMLSRREHCGDPGYECPMQDAYKPGSTIELAEHARAALRAAGRVQP